MPTVRVETDLSPEIFLDNFLPMFIMAMLWQNCWKKTKIDIVMNIVRGCC